jgi:hypothetical protein
MSHFRTGIFFSITAVSIFALFTVCNKNSPEKKPYISQDGQVQTQPANQKDLSSLQNSAVCLWPDLAVRKEAGNNAKYLSSLSLGETVKLLGDEVVDSANSSRGFVKIELSDGKVGWVNKYCIVPNARAGAVKQEEIVNKRPDPLTSTGKKLQPMKLVAVSEPKDGWVEVVSEKRELSGWISESAVSVDPKDVTIAALASQKGISFNDTSKVKIEKFIAESPYPDCYFVTALKEKISTNSNVTSENPPSVQNVIDTNSLNNGAATEENTD